MHNMSWVSGPGKVHTFTSQIISNLKADLDHGLMAVEPSILAIDVRLGNPLAHQMPCYHHISCIKTYEVQFTKLC